jgi:hypothetical protein
LTALFLTSPGVEKEVIASISKSMDNIPFTSHLERLVIGTAIHCKRRAGELKGSIEMLEDRKLPYDMTQAAKNKMEKLQTYEFAKKFIERKPNGWEEIINIILQETKGE